MLSPALLKRDALEPCRSRVSSQLRTDALRSRSEQLSLTAGDIGTLIMLVKRHSACFFCQLIREMRHFALLKEMMFGGKKVEGVVRDGTHEVEMRRTCGLTR
jgi:hypothetical protein